MTAIWCKADAQQCANSRRFGANFLLSPPCQVSVESIQWRRVDSLKNLDHAIFNLSKKVINVRNLPERAKAFFQELLKCAEPGRMSGRSHGAKGYPNHWNFDE